MGDYENTNYFLQNTNVQNRFVVEQYKFQKQSQQLTNFLKEIDSNGIVETEDCLIRSLIMSDLIDGKFGSQFDRIQFENVLQLQTFHPLPSLIAKQKYCNVVVAFEEKIISNLGICKRRSKNHKKFSSFPKNKNQKQEQSQPFLKETIQTFFPNLNDDNIFVAESFFSKLNEKKERNNNNKIEDKLIEQLLLSKKKFKKNKKILYQDLKKKFKKKLTKKFDTILLSQQIESLKPKKQRSLIELCKTVLSLDGSGKILITFSKSKRNFNKQFGELDFVKRAKALGFKIRLLKKISTQIENKQLNEQGQEKKQGQKQEKRQEHEDGQTNDREFESFSLKKNHLIEIYILTLEEHFDVLDENRVPLNYSLPRSVVHSKGIWHSVCDVWLYNFERKQLLLQKRAPNKSYPGILDVSCSGHLSQGEIPTTGAVRELKEELGISVKKSQLIPVFTDRLIYKTTKKYVREFIHIFILPWDKIETDQFKFLDGEVDQVFWFDLNYLLQVWEKKDPKYTPITKQYSNKLVSAIKKLSQSSSKLN
ncbi:isopentenyl-diphosphate delta-isomerase [Anaeramoeba flamelloides]|uniref:Isopentenyl-diphosphate delta-isomerase n=1 Tax=Anaeramoeba flamelloides TaxID=1746091 RepID=A0AAV8A9R1_9EUKA|nr:isopentenyl-diphosphate delta-isomerase [Anaeramoeba flamelloides]